MSYSRSSCCSDCIGSMANLIRRMKRKNLILSRKMRKKKMTNKTEWFVGKQTNGKTFYVCEHDNENNTTMW